MVRSKVDFPEPLPPNSNVHSTRFPNMVERGLKRGSLSLCPTTNFDATSNS